jgi:hypothetical protein
MTELIPTINEIVKYGLQSNLTVSDKEKLLERHLVKIYDLYFDIEYIYDDRNFPDIYDSQITDIRRNVESNFKDYGFYKTSFDVNDIENLEGNTIGDAIDDLCDIITDLLEVKWRIENNSLADGLWYLQLIFQSHTQQHILDLLNYMKRKNG